MFIADKFWLVIIVGLSEIVLSRYDNSEVYYESVKTWNTTHLEILLPSS